MVRRLFFGVGAASSAPRRICPADRAAAATRADLPGEPVADGGTRIDDPVEDLNLLEPRGLGALLVDLVTRD